MLRVQNRNFYLNKKQKYFLFLNSGFAVDFLLRCNVSFELLQLFKNHNP